MARYSPEQIYAFALAAGFDPNSATTMTAIAMAESGGRSTAHATGGEDSRGLWQINLNAHPELANVDLYDPAQNARAAYQVSHGGADVSPWSTTHGGLQASYLRFRADAQAAAAAHGERSDLGAWLGTAGYGHPLAAAGADLTAAGGADLPPAAAPHGVQVAAVDPSSTPGQPSGSELLGAITPTAGADPLQAPPGGGNPAESGLHGVAVSVGGSAGDSAGGSADGSAGGSAEGSAEGHGVLIGAPTGEGSGSNPQGAVESFVEHALEMHGDKYVYGATASMSDPHPSAFDCSELTRWAAHQSGLFLPDGAWPQYEYVKQHGSVISAEQALHTRGALLFRFSDLQTGGSPMHSHVAISLGDGRTIEARGSAYGVGTWSGENRFTIGGVLPAGSAGAVPDSTVPAGAEPAGPGVGAGSEPTGHGVLLQGAGLQGGALIDTDHDGLADSLEQHLHTDPFNADTDHDGLSDAFEVLYGHSNPLAADTDLDALEHTLQGASLSLTAPSAIGTDPSGSAVVTAVATSAKLPSLELSGADTGGDDHGGHGDHAIGDHPVFLATPVDLGADPAGAHHDAGQGTSLTVTPAVTAHPDDPAAHPGGAEHLGGDAHAY